MTAAEPASPEPAPPPSPADGSRPWLTKGVTGIGVASLLADVGHEIPTALLASFMTVVLGAPAAALGLVEGLSDAISGFAKLAGGALADDPQRRRRVALGGYIATAILSASVGLATTAWQVAVLRSTAWAARGIRGPARNALLADAVRTQVLRPCLRVRASPRQRRRDHRAAARDRARRRRRHPRRDPPVGDPGPVRGRGDRVRDQQPADRDATRAPPDPARDPAAAPRAAGPAAGAITVFELANVATSLLILRATELFIPSMGADRAAITGIGLYVGYNVAATVVSFRRTRRRRRRWAAGAGRRDRVVRRLLCAPGGDRTGPRAARAGVHRGGRGHRRGRDGGERHGRVAAPEESAAPRSGCSR